MRRITHFHLKIFSLLITVLLLLSQIAVASVDVYIQGGSPECNFTQWENIGNPPTQKKRTVKFDVLCGNGGKQVSVGGPTFYRDSTNNNKIIILNLAQTKFCISNTLYQAPTNYMCLTYKKTMTDPICIARVPNVGDLPLPIILTADLLQFVQLQCGDIKIEAERFITAGKLGFWQTNLINQNSFRCTLPVSVASSIDTTGIIETQPL